MARRPNRLRFDRKLVLNQWALGLFECSTLEELANGLKDPELEKPDSENVSRYCRILGAKTSPDVVGHLKFPECGGVFWTMFELSLNKIQNNDVRFRPPPLRFGGTKTEKSSLHFLFFSRAIFSFKRKRKFFCFVFLLIREKRKRSIFNRKRAKIPSPRPPSFLPFCFHARKASETAGIFFILQF